MRDALDARIWADHHHHFSASVTAGLKALWRGFKRLNAIRFDAPWKAASRPRSCR